jgi:hypothetical protein
LIKAALIGVVDFAVAIVIATGDATFWISIILQEKLLFLLLISKITRGARTHFVNGEPTRRVVY